MVLLFLQEINMNPNWSWVRHVFDFSVNEQNELLVLNLLGFLAVMLSIVIISQFMLYSTENHINISHGSINMGRSAQL